MSIGARRHPTIPLSPPSPPADTLKERLKKHRFDYNSQLPASPYMSVAAKSYGQPFANTPSSSHPEAMQQSPSPPISALMSTQVSQQPSVTTDSSPPMPENSVIGQTRKASDDIDDDHITKRPKIDGNLTLRQDPSGLGIQEISHLTEAGALASRSTDLDRDALPKENPLSVGSEEARAGTQPASDEAQSFHLRKNVDEVFHLCKSTIPRIRPDPQQHLLSTYGLSDLHSKVVRADPVTHEKINKLRRSYEGHIKSFALAGRNKPVKDEIPEGQWSSLNMIMLEPDESWHASKVAGKKIEITSDLESRLRKAMSLQPGRSRDHDHWNDLLGHEKPRSMQPQEPVGQKTALPSLRRPSSNRAIINQASQITNTGEAIRPRRSGKKRSYADSSFEGYGDGYVDDETVDPERAILSNSEDGSRGSRRKKRRKDQSFSGSAPIHAGGASYGVGGWHDGDR